MGTEDDGGKIIFLRPPEGNPPERRESTPSQQIRLGRLFYLMVLELAPNLRVASPHGSGTPENPDQLPLTEYITSLAEQFDLSVPYLSRLVERAAVGIAKEALPEFRSLRDETLSDGSEQRLKLGWEENVRVAEKIARDGLKASLGDHERLAFFWQDRLPKIVQNPRIRLSILRK